MNPTLPDIASMTDDELRAWLRGKKLPAWIYIVRGERRLHRPVFKNDTASASHWSYADGHTEPVTCERDVLLAMVSSHWRRFVKRSEAAKHAARTRAKRTELAVYRTAQGIVEGQAYGPAMRCRICGKALFDPESIQRAVGSECWSHVLAAIEANERHALARPPDPKSDRALQALASEQSAGVENKKQGTGSVARQRQVAP